MAPSFACIVQPKVIEIGTDQKPHRAQKDEELRAELELLAATAPPSTASGGRAQSAFQPGGGCYVVLGSDPEGSSSIATVGTAVCVFVGRLSNAAALAEAYAPLPERVPSPAGVALTGAELIAHMYAKVGVELLGLLRGAFTFVLYESKTSRVLAARDGTGACPLWQARGGASGSLVLSCERALLEAAGCGEVVELLPGDYKYGWSATPRRYQPAEPSRFPRRSLDPSASPASPHHHNHNHHHHDGAAAVRPRRTSVEHHGPAVAAAAGAQQSPPPPHTLRAGRQPPAPPAASHGPGAGSSPAQAQAGHPPRDRDRKPAASHSGQDQQAAVRPAAGQHITVTVTYAAAVASASSAPAAKAAAAAAQLGAAAGQQGGGRPRSGASGRPGRNVAPRPADAGRRAVEPERSGDGAAVAAAAVSAAASAAAAVSLRADAPEWKPRWAAAPVAMAASR